MKQPVTKELMQSLQSGDKVFFRIGGDRVLTEENFVKEVNSTYPYRIFIFDNWYNFTEAGRYYSGTLFPLDIIQIEKSKSKQSGELWAVVKQYKTLPNKISIWPTKEQAQQYAKSLPSNYKVLAIVPTGIKWVEEDGLNLVQSATEIPIDDTCYACMGAHTEHVCSIYRSKTKCIK